MAEKKYPSHETITRHLKKFQKDRDEIFGRFNPIYVEYCLYKNKYDEEKSANSPDFVLDRLTKLMQEQKDKAHAVIEELRNKDQELEAYEEKIKKDRNISFVLDFPEHVEFDVDKYDELESANLEVQKETIKNELNDPDMDNQFHEGELSDEDLLKMNPTTAEDYEAYLKDIKDAKFYPSKRMVRLQECRENDYIMLEIIDAKINCFEAYKTYYKAFGRDDKLKLIEQRVLYWGQQKEFINDHIASIQGHIGNEGKHIKAALKDRVDYYSDKLDELQNNRGYGKK